MTYLFGTCIFLAFDEKQAEKRDEIARRPLFAPSMTTSTSLAVTSSSIQSDSPAVGKDSDQKQLRIVETRKKLGLKSDSSAFNSSSSKVNDSSKSNSSRSSVAQYKTKLNQLNLVKKKSSASPATPKHNDATTSAQASQATAGTSNSANLSLVGNYDSATSSSGEET